MFRKGKDKELDVTSLNEIIHTGKKFVNIAYFMTIIAIVLLGTYILKEWKVFGIIGIQIAQPIADVLAFVVALPMVWLFIKKLPKDELDAF